jgi:hypothetical protein
MQLYDTIIEQPMDLGTMRDKLARGKYPNIDAFLGDARCGLMIPVSTVRWRRAFVDTYAFEMRGNAVAQDG